MSHRTVLVLGATGRLGAAVAAAFAAAGWRVLAQSRRAPASLPAGAAHLGVALEDTAALVAAAAGADVVVHAVNPAYTDWERLLLPLGRLALDAAERLGAVFMLPGNVYGFGEQMPAVLREDTPERPTTSKGRLRVALEAEMRDRAEAGRLRAVVVRAGDFYGAGQGSWLDLAVVKSMREGKLVYPGPLDRPHAWAYLPDLARAFVAVAERATGGAATAAPAFETLHFEGHTLTGAELLDLVQATAAGIGLAPARGWRRGGMPWAFIRAMGLFVPMMRAIAEMSYLWRVPHALDGTRLAARVGALAQTPPRQAMRQALLDLGFGAGAPSAAAAH
ncbi:MAG: NAD-dependent epimerase/dehydratase family protein [Pseudomonadota bacterium]|jgi:nucleoside-diphosphate-sugar epimerase|nr:NAD-dependent epimerase/dehydratase family protein [Rubrivivax sp.]